MSDDAVRRALADLTFSTKSTAENRNPLPPTGQGQTFRETIQRATDAVEDIDAAAAFVEEVGLDELKRAIKQAKYSVSACADDGQRTLEAFSEFRSAAEGGRASGDPKSDHRNHDGDHFHPGRGTSLGGGDIAQSK